MVPRKGKYERFSIKNRGFFNVSNNVCFYPPDDSSEEKLSADGNTFEQGCYRENSRHCSVYWFYYLGMVRHL